ncbi:phage tail protein, partial [Shigella sonnei]|uniref:phage tail protein n=1 Tax=Shigella sonnei TaxID=624 RepID=UPI00209282D2
VPFDGTQDINITSGITQQDADSRYIQDITISSGTVTAIRLGSVTAHMPGTWESWDLNLGGGNVLTGIKVQDVGKNTADNVGGVYYRPLQYLLNGAWVTAASI